MIANVKQIISVVSSLRVTRCSYLNFKRGIFDFTLINRINYIHYISHFLKYFFKGYVKNPFHQSFSKAMGNIT